MGEMEKRKEVIGENEMHWYQGKGIQDVFFGIIGELWLKVHKANCLKQLP